MRPYSFLTLSSFTLATIARYSIACLLLAWIDLTRGCRSATQLPVRYPPASDLLKVPQLDDIVYLALPIVLFVVSIAKLANWFLTKGNRDTRARDQRITQLFIYAASVQFIILPLAGATAYLATDQLKADWFSPDKDVFWAILFTSPAILWPLFSMYRAGTGLEPKSIFRLGDNRAWRPFFGIVCALALLATLSASVGISYLLAERDINGATEKAPVVSATYLSLRQINAATMELVILARNNSDTDLWLKSDRIVAFRRLWPKGRIAEAEASGGFFRMPARKDTIISLMISAEYQGDVQDLKTASLFFRPPAPLQFVSVDSEGHWQDLAVEPEPGQNLDGSQFEGMLESIQNRLTSRSIPNAQIPAAAHEEERKNRIDATTVDRSMPIPTYQTRPIYPFQLRRDGIEGSATVRFVVDVNGNVVEPAVSSATNAAFGEAALKCISQWRYLPALRNGGPVRMNVEIPITFSLLSDE